MNPQIIRKGSFKDFKKLRQTTIKEFDFEKLEMIQKVKVKSEYERLEEVQKNAEDYYKELSKQRNLFDQIRVPFQNLAYEKEKAKGTRGRGGKVSGITFTFKPENIKMQKRFDKEKSK